MEKGVLAVIIWALFIGGLFGGAAGMFKFLTGGTPLEYGVMGIGGGFWLACSALAGFLRRKL